MTPDEERELIESTRALKQAVLGLPGTTERGLCGLVEVLAADHYRLKRLVYVLVALLVGSGVLAGGIIGLVTK